MKKLFLLALLPLNLFSQVNITGVVVDSHTGDPMPYTSIYIEGTSKGTIANSEGAFEFKYSASKDDIVTFSYVGYQNKKVAIKDLRSLKKIHLSKSISQITEVEIGGYFPKYLAKVLLKAKTKLTKDRHKTIDAKSFAKIFSTKNDTIDVELFKAFYASKMNSYEIKENTFKNAKILVDNKYGVSVSSLDIFYQFIRNINFLYLEDVNSLATDYKKKKSKNYVDFENPLLYKSVSPIIKKFHLEAEKLDANLIRINYVYKKDKSQRGSFVLDTETKQFYDIRLNTFYKKNPPLHFVGDVFTIDSLALEYTLKFNNRKQPNLFKLNFEYFFKDSLAMTNKIESEAELFVYDVNNTFSFPQYNFKRNVFNNDYFLAGITPINDNVWKIEPQIVQSQRQYEFAENQSTTLEYISEEPIEIWSEAWEPDVDKVQTFKSVTEVFSIETMIFYDVYSSGSKNYVETAALIDYKRTYWSVKPDLVLIKKVFDLTAAYAEDLKAKLLEEKDKTKHAQIYERLWEAFLNEKERLISRY